MNQLSEAQHEAFLESLPHSWRIPVHESYPKIDKIAGLLGAINAAPACYAKNPESQQLTFTQGLLLEQFFHHTAMLYQQTQEDCTHPIYPEHADAIRAAASLKDGAINLRDAIEVYVDGLDTKQVMRSFGRGEQPGLDDTISAEVFWDDKKRLKYWLNEALDRAERISHMPYTTQFLDTVLPASIGQEKR